MAAAAYSVTVWVRGPSRPKMRYVLIGLKDRSSSKENIEQAKAALLTSNVQEGNIKTLMEDESPLTIEDIKAELKQDPDVPLFFGIYGHGGLKNKAENSGFKTKVDGKEWHDEDIADFIAKGLFEDNSDRIVVGLINMCYSANVLPLIKKKCTPTRKLAVMSGLGLQDGSQTSDFWTSWFAEMKSLPMPLFSESKWNLFVQAVVQALQCSFIDRTAFGTLGKMIRRFYQHDPSLKPKPEPEAIEKIRELVKAASFDLINSESLKAKLEENCLFPLFDGDTLDAKILTCITNEVYDIIGEPTDPALPALPSAKVIANYTMKGSFTRTGKRDTDGLLLPRIYCSNHDFFGASADYFA